MYRSRAVLSILSHPFVAVCHAKAARCNSTAHAGAQLSPTIQYILASIGAGSINVCVTNPLWVVKTRLQTQSMPKELRIANFHATNYTGTFDALSTLLRKEGMRGMYAGLVPSFIGIAHVAIQFPLYEALKQQAGRIRGRDADNLTAADLVVLSSAAKMVASTATYPHEVIRSQMHISKAGAVGVRDVCVRVRSAVSLACISRVLSVCENWMHK